MISLFRHLRENNRLPGISIFFLTTALCVIMVAFRMHHTSSVTFVFLIWNIFLAAIPYGISTLLVLYHHRVSRWLLSIPFLAWLCFFPNAPYILTDLFHLRERSGVPYWYDLALILFFAWNGLMLGYASLIDVQGVITKRFNAVIGWIITIGCLILGSFGIYLGRYLRWNSWDVVSSPTGLLYDIATRILHPFSHPQTFGVTIVFSLFLILGYLLLIYISGNGRSVFSREEIK